MLKMLLDLLARLFGGGKTKTKKKALPPKTDPKSDPKLADELEPEPEPELDGDGADEYEDDFAAQPERKTVVEHGMAEVRVILRLNDEGAQVKEFQTWLEKLGYELTRFGADGGLGLETLQEVADFQDDDREKGGTLKDEEHAIKLQGVGEKTYLAIKAAAKAAPVVSPPPEPEPDADSGEDTPDNFFRLCPESGKGVKAKRKRKKGWKSVVGITLHQTACDLGTTPTRFKKVSAHIGTTQDGKVVQMNGLDWVVYHGHSFNGSRGPGDVGIEINGHFAGLEPYDEDTGEWKPNLKTYWKPKSRPNRVPMSVSPEQVKATLDAIDWIIAEVKKHGGEVKYIHAHRQSSKSRTSDPGEKVWRLIALVAMKKHGLTDGGPKFVAGGYPVPNQWAQDPAYTAKYRSY